MSVGLYADVHVPGPVILQLRLRGVDIRAARVTSDELRKLHRGLQKELNEAIVAGGSSVSDYVDSAGDEGFFQFHHRSYGSEHET